jgi:DNA-binding transcriptional ArsR family regulator
MAAKRTSAARAAQAPVRRQIHRAPVAPRPATDLDRLLHDRTRLAIVSALAVNDALSFGELKALTETTDGNLSVHTRKLEEGAYVTCTKSFDGRVPRTEFAITPAGRRALQKYLDHMEAIIRHARPKAR